MTMSDITNTPSACFSAEGKWQGQLHFGGPVGLMWLNDPFMEFGTDARRAWKIIQTDKGESQSWDGGEEDGQ